MIKTEWGVMGLQGVMGEIVWNLLEKYWFLDSFGADLVLESGRDMRGGGNADFWTIFLYLIRRVENVYVGWVME